MAAAIRDAGLHPSRLALEVTESLFLDDSESQRRTLVALEELGVSISLDDFGTGYSSLSYLTRFPIGTLKVDRSFISKLDDDREEEAIVAMARALNLRVVAEGVEQEGQVRSLRRLGSDLAQGYLFGRPRPAGDIPALRAARLRKPTAPAAVPVGEPALAAARRLTA